MDDSWPLRTSEDQGFDPQTCRLHGGSALEQHQIVPDRASSDTIAYSSKYKPFITQLIKYARLSSDPTWI